MLEKRRLELRAEPGGKKEAEMGAFDVKPELVEHARGAASSAHSAFAPCTGVVTLQKENSAERKPAASRSGKPPKLSLGYFNSRVSGTRSGARL